MHAPVFKLAASFLWAALAVSAAASAHATIATSQSGDYASCSASYQTMAYTCMDEASWKLDFYYQQNIKLVSTACSSGGCNSDTGTVRSDMVYATGRKQATLINSCSSLMLFGLGSCAC